MNWLNDSEFIYTKSVEGGAKYMHVNVLEKSKTPAFDHEKMANAITEISGTTFTATRSSNQ